MSYIEKIDRSLDLKQFTIEQLPDIAEEIRQEIISVVSENGGHLASNLGAVELTLALHYCLDIPGDLIVWDVGHQSYVHKMLTGRRKEIKTIRKYRGLSGFPKREESEADPFGAGHASTSISAALGLAAARDSKGLQHKVVAVVGDGALTGGLAFEGLNNAGASKRDIMVILNDNEMSISKNVGGLSKYLTTILVDQRYNKLRDEIWEMTGRFKRRDSIRETVSRLEDSVKALFVPGYVFDRLGFRYFGPIDGHDLPLLIKTLNQMKALHGPLLLHVLTTKGKGYAPAEADATRFHGIGTFDKITGKSNGKSGRPSYTSVFGDTIANLAGRNDRIVAITAAMTSGTGLTKFAEKYPDRFYDVGIAEAHASCFAAGLAAGGMRPFVAIYSTFLQRAYDQIIHDIALQKLPVVFCIDRAGLVGEDGPTHHGAFDISYFLTVPNAAVMAPRNGNELRAMLELAAFHDISGPCAIRYPRASIPDQLHNWVEKLEWGTWEVLHDAEDIAVIAVGTMVDVALRAREALKGIKDFAVINARFIKPYDSEILEKCRKKYRHIITVEENSIINGFGWMIGCYLSNHGYEGEFEMFGIPDKFIGHGHRDILLRDIGLDVGKLADHIEHVDINKKDYLRKVTLKARGRSKQVTADYEKSRRTASGK